MGNHKFKIYSEEEKQAFADYVKKTDKVADLVCEDTGVVMHLNWEYDMFTLKYGNDEISAHSIDINDIFNKLYIVIQEKIDILIEHQIWNKY